MLTAPSERVVFGRLCYILAFAQAGAIVKKSSGAAASAMLVTRLRNYRSGINELT